jgi:hypothetical protein
VSRIGTYSYIPIFPGMFFTTDDSQWYKTEGCFDDSTGIQFRADAEDLANPGALAGTPSQQNSPLHLPGHYLKSQNNFPGNPLLDRAAREYTTIIKGRGKNGWD